MQKKLWTRKVLFQVYGGDPNSVPEQRAKEKAIKDKERAKKTRLAQLMQEQFGDAPAESNRMCCNILKVNNTNIEQLILPEMHMSRLQLRGM